MKKFISKLNDFIINYGFLTLSLIAVVLELVFRTDLDVQVYGLLIIQYLVWVMQKLREIIRLMEIQIMLKTRKDNES